MKGVGVEEASLPNAFAAPRLAMLVAFIDQVSSVHSLCRKRDAGGANRSEASILTKKASEIARQVDSIVSGASPELVIARIGHAWSSLTQLWPQSLTTINTNHNADTMSRHTKNRASQLGLVGCPDSLLTILIDMLDTLQQEGLSGSGPKSTGAWKSGGYHRLGDAYQGTMSFAAALTRFSEALYDQPVEVQDRIRYAIQQADNVLTTMKFCHLIILTQLNLPRDWYYKTRFIPATITVGTLSSLVHFFFSTSHYVKLVAIGSTAVILYADINSYFWKAPKALPSPEYDETLKLSIEVLGLRLSTSSMEARSLTLSHHLRFDLETRATLSVLEKWQARLEKGMNERPGERSGWSIHPSMYWAKWLLDAARTETLRQHCSGGLRIGVEGPVEAGKSELLAVLTNTGNRVFHPGDDADHRTMDIRMYEQEGGGAVFIDCPGEDDQQEGIREIGNIVRDMLNVIIFVFPLVTANRSEAASNFFTKVANFLRSHHSRSDYRPVRILLSKADCNYHPSRVEAFKKTREQYKAKVISELETLGGLGQDFRVFSRRTYQGMSLIVAEPLEQVVQVYSSHAQKATDGTALCDHDERTENVGREIYMEEHFKLLYDMAEAEELWDVVSLRRWLNELKPNCVTEKIVRIPPRPRGRAS